MCFLFKTLFRTAIIGTALTAAVVGGSAMIVGPDRVGAFAEQVKGDLENHFDANLDDPVVMRRQLRQMERQYPARIKEVRRDLSSLQEEKRRLQREKKVADRVVELVDADLEHLTPVVAAAEAQASGGKARLVAVEFGDEVLTLSRLKQRVLQIERTKLTSQETAAGAQHSLKYLSNQEERFESLLVRLEDEQAQLSAQLVQLENEVESIARNERLINLLNARQRTLDDAKAFDVQSLDGMRSMLERKRIEQEAELDRIGSGEESLTYEQRAAATLQLETR